MGFGGNQSTQRSAGSKECVPEENKDILGKWATPHSIFWHRVCLNSAQVWRIQVKLNSKPVNQVICTGNIKVLSLRAVAWLVLTALIQVCGEKAAEWSRKKCGEEGTVSSLKSQTRRPRRQQLQ